MPDAPARNGADAEFVITVKNGSAPDLTSRLRLDPSHSSRDRRWRKLVLELRNHEPQEVEVSLTTRVRGDTGGDPWAIWGEPSLEWRRPLGEIRRLLQAVARPALGGNLVNVARTLYNRLTTSFNPSRYQLWLAARSPSHETLERMRARSASFPYRPLVSVVTPVYNTDGRWLRACIESVKGQAYPHWQLCLADDGSTRPETRAILREYEADPRIKVQTLPANQGIAAASNAALRLADGDFIAFLDHDDEIGPEALFEVVAHLNEHPDADFIYSDEDKLEIDGTRGGVYFKPDWSHDHFLTNMYTCHLMVVRRTLIERAGGFRPGYEGAQDYDLVLRLIELTTRIDHLPKVLYHWRRIPESTAGRDDAKPWAHNAGRLALDDYVRRNQLAAEVLPGAFPYLYRVRFAIKGEPAISVVLPAIPDAANRAALDACQRTLDTLVVRTAYRRLEVVLATPGDRPYEPAIRIPPVLQPREVRIDGALPEARLRQQMLAARQASGDHLLFMDWGLAAMDAEWLTALLEYSQQPAVGAVGAKLFYPDGSLKHIGLVLGVKGVAAPAFHRHSRFSQGYWGTAIAVRNYSAVSGVCLMTRRQVFQEVGGFLDQMGSLGDVDYCLRVRAAGYRVVFTPHAPLIHAPVREQAAPGVPEAGRFCSTWGDAITRDPYYNVNFSRETPDYEPDLRPCDT
jgi:GT2 family glycosyltransferase